MRKRNNSNSSVSDFYIHPAVCISDSNRNADGLFEIKIFETDDGAIGNCRYKAFAVSRRDVGLSVSFAVSLNIFSAAVIQIAAQSGGIFASCRQGSTDTLCGYLNLIYCSVCVYCYGFRAGLTGEIRIVRAAVIENIIFSVNLFYRAVYRSCGSFSLLVAAIAEVAV